MDEDLTFWCPTCDDLCEKQVAQGDGFIACKKCGDLVLSRTSKHTEGILFRTNSAS